jgi:cytochrome b561
MTIDGMRAKALHWLVFVLVAAQFIVAIAMPDIGRGSLLALIGLHVGAALYHYFVRLDGVLQRMLPGAAR